MNGGKKREGGRVGGRHKPAHCIEEEREVERIEGEREKWIEGERKEQNKT